MSVLALKPQTLLRDATVITALTAAAFVRVVPAVVVPVTPPSQWDAAMVVTAEVSVRITGQFIWERSRHINEDTLINHYVLVKAFSKTLIKLLCQ